MRKRITVTIMLLILCVATAAPVLAAPPSKSYTYTAEGLAVPSPTPYTYDTEIGGDKYGIGTFKNPEDLFIDSDNYIYILDTGNARVVVFDEEKNLVRVIDNIKYKNETVTLNSPKGLFVYEYYDKKYLYIADTANARIMRLDMLNQLNVEDIHAPIEVDKMYNEPAIDIVDSKTTYQPSKLVVDRAERIYVICNSINKGIVKLTLDGTFDTFFGAPDVTYTAIEAFWRMISTPAQLRRMRQYVPTEYSNIATDLNGFIYVTTSAIDRNNIYNSFWTKPTDLAGRQQYAPIKKLAADGTDILARTGIFPPVGDIAVYTTTEIETSSYSASTEILAGVSAFTDVAINEFDVYSIADNRRCKVFTYDSDGNLLFEFGSAGSQDGTFRTPTAISYFRGNQIAVLDGHTETSSLSFFKPTDYGQSILNAVDYYNKGEYEKSEQQWVKVLKMNSNMTQAYSGVGKSLLRSGNYSEAMANFKISKNAEYYSKALEEYLNQSIGNKFTYIFLIVVGAFILYTVYKWVKRFRRFLREGVKKVV